MFRLLSSLIITASMIMLGACSMPEVPNDPNFAPVIPDREPELTPDMGSIYFPKQGLSLYEDIKAHKVGDIITVLLLEKTDAKKKAENKAEKNNDVDIDEPEIFGTSAKWKLPKQLPVPLQTAANLGLATQIDSDVNFKGTADAKQENELKGTITVMVTKVYPNGNLYVRGEKWININEGDEYVRVSGIIRTEDVNPDNTIDSNRIADARISYSGKGSFANSNKPGWLVKILSHPWWPI